MMNDMKGNGFGVVYKSTCEWFSRNHPTIFKEENIKLEVKDTKEMIFDAVFLFFMQRYIANKALHCHKFDTLDANTKYMPNPEIIKNKTNIKLQMD